MDKGKPHYSSGSLKRELPGFIPQHLKPKDKRMHSVILKADSYNKKSGTTYRKTGVPLKLK